ncbi:MinD superfamily P-loop ATPase [Desulfitispora alkaliphila]|uniref:ATP-binding protein n=1 Tax=Desulfitispora alkaliphila TaxID=622674 RepID=UPI003D237D21
MKIAVVSGKGGTGKTTIAASFAELEKNPIRVDCDVDAPNMYLYYKGNDINKQDFIGSELAVVDYDLCNQCGECKLVCRFEAIAEGVVDTWSCEGCGACTLVCPQEAIKLEKEKSAEAYITEVDNGLISRAEMEVGSEGSGKLVTQLRKNAEEFSWDSRITIVDGSPGIGCSVIASITGNNAVIIVTEPTKSGMDDFIRVKQLCDHFSIPALVCINKYDINKEITWQIEGYCKERDIPIVGKIGYDDTVLKSINELKPIIYYEQSEANKAIRKMWTTIKNLLQKQGNRV